MFAPSPHHSQSIARALAAFVVGLSLVVRSSGVSHAQTQPAAIRACRGSAAPTLSAAMLRANSSVRFAVRVTRSAPVCSYRSTTTVCIARCTVHAVAQVAGRTVHIQGDPLACTTGDSARSIRCSFTNGSTLVIEGTARSAGGAWWIDASSACRP